MRNALLIAASLVAFVVPTFAADMPTKAPVRYRAVVNPCGWYFGVHTVAENEKVAVTGSVPSSPSAVFSNLGGLTNIGAGVGGTVGYRCGNGPVWYAAEFMGSWRNIGQTVTAVDGNNGATIIPASVSGRWGVTERLKVGGPWQAVFDALPAVGNLLPVQPALPPNATDAQAYLFAALHQDDISASFGLAQASAWRVRAGIGLGTDFALGLSAAIPLRQDVWVEYIPAGQGLNLGLPGGFAAKVNSGSEIRLGTAIHFNAGTP